MCLCHPKAKYIAVFSWFRSFHFGCWQDEEPGEREPAVSVTYTYSLVILLFKLFVFHLKKLALTCKKCYFFQQRLLENVPVSD